jgi:hypothetical protein
VWPHHIVVGINGLAVSIGSDDPDTIDRLEPWRVDVDTELIDYGLQLHPAPGQDRGPRRLPRLMHGSCDLIRLHDENELITALLRILASFSEEPHPNVLRVSLMTLVHEGRALLIPIDHGGRISRRWFARKEIQPLYGLSSLIDVEQFTVSVDAPISANASQTATARVSYPLADWWLPTVDESRPLSPGHAVAHTMTMVQGITGDNAQEVLADLAGLVTTRPPSLIPAAPNVYMEQIDPGGADALRRQVCERITQAFVTR